MTTPRSPRGRIAKGQQGELLVERWLLRQDFDVLPLSPTFSAGDLAWHLFPYFGVVEVKNGRGPTLLSPNEKRLIAFRAAESVKKSRGYRLCCIARDAPFAAFYTVLGVEPGSSPRNKGRETLSLKVLKVGTADLLSSVGGLRMLLDGEAYPSAEKDGAEE